MKEKFIKMLNITHSDISKLVYLLLLLLFSGAGNIVGTIAANSLFVIKFGVEKLPLMFMLTAVVTMIFSIWFFAVSRKISRIKSFLLFYTIFAGLIFLCRALAEIRFIEQGILFYPFLFIVSGFIGLVSPMLFWLVTNDICNSREAKRLFPLIMGGAQIGVTAVCFSMKFITNSIGTKNVLLLWFGAILASILVFYRISIKFRNLLTTSIPTGEKAVINFRTLRYNFIAVVQKSPFVKYLALSFILMAILGSSMHFNYYSIVKDVFPDVDKFTAINGFVQGAANALVLILQLFVTSRIIVWFGIGITLLIFPVGILFSFSVLLFHSFSAAVFAKINTYTLNFSIQKPISAIIYNPIEKKRRSQTITYINGFVHPLGDFIGGLVILVVRFIPVKNILLYVSLGLSVIWLVINWLLKEKYIRMVLQSLKGADYDARFEAIRIIQNFKGPEAVASLLEAIKDPNPVIRSNAALALGKIKDKKVVSALIDTAKQDENKYVRAAAVQSLGEIGDVSTLEPLVAMLKREYSERVRATIISVLKDYHEEKLINILVGFLNDEDSRVRANTTEVLGELGDEKLKQKIFPLLNDPNNRVVANAVVTLYPWASHEERKMLNDRIINMTKSDKEEDRASAYFIIGSIGDSNLFEYLKQGVSEISVMVRKQVAKALGNFANPFIIDPIMKLLGDEDYQIRNMASSVALDKKDMFFEHLINMLPIADSVQKKVQIIGLLGGIGNKKAADTIVELLKDTDEEIRLRAVIALGKLNVTPANVLLPLLGDGSSKVRSATVKVLGRLDPVLLRTCITKMLTDENERARANAIEALALNPTEGSVDIFKKYLLDDHYRVRASASIALWKSNSRDGIPVLKELLSSEEKWHRATALYAFGEIGSTEFLEDILKFLDDEDLDIKRLAAAALEKIGGPALESLERFLHQKEAGFEEKNRSFVIACIGEMLNTDDPEAKKVIMDSLEKSDLPEIEDRMKGLLRTEDQLLRDKILDVLGEFKYEHLMPLSLKGLNFIDLNSQLKISNIFSKREIILEAERDAAVEFTGRIIKQICDYQKYSAIFNPLSRYKSCGQLDKEIQRIINISVKIIINILKGLGNREDIDTIAKKLDDPDERIRANALGALETIGDRHVIKSFMPTLERIVMKENITGVNVDMYEGLRALWNVFKISDSRIKTLCISAITEILSDICKECLDKINSIKDPKLKEEMLKITDILKGVMTGHTN